MAFGGNNPIAAGIRWLWRRVDPVDLALACLAAQKRHPGQPGAILEDAAVSYLTGSYPRVSEESMRRDIRRHVARAKEVGR